MSNFTEGLKEFEQPWRDAVERNRERFADLLTWVLREAGYATGVPKELDLAELGIDEKDLPELEDAQYPPYVLSDDERTRFRLCHAIAAKMMEAEGPENIWAMTRSLYNNPNVTI